MNVGKWFTPSVGARLGYNGLTGAEWSNTASVLGTSLDASKNMYKQQFGFAYVHADVLWNISHAFSGYKETRFWNFIPYFHSGYHLTYGKKDVDYRDQELAAGFGLLTTSASAKGSTLLSMYVASCSAEDIMRLQVWLVTSLPPSDFQ